YFRMRDLRKALSDLNKAIALDPDHSNVDWTMKCRADVYRLQGNFDGALKECKEIADKFPGFAWGPYMLGVIEYERGNYKEAAVHYQKVVDGDSEHLRPFAQVRIFLARSHLKQEAAKALAKFRYTWPGNEWPA
ncbi:unnamed protein product, partial [marine sediment metagenome]